MLAALGRIKTALAGLGYPVHVLAAQSDKPDSGPAVPYVVLEVAPGQGLDPDEPPLCRAGQELQFSMRVRAVSFPADAPVKVLTAVRGVLAPGLLGSHLTGGGRVVDVEYEGLEVASVEDRDMTAVNLDRHPSWGLDAYTVHVQQA